MTPTTPALVAALLGRGVRLARRGDVLAYTPTEAVGATTLAAMRERKPELLELLDLAAGIEADGEVPRLRALYDGLDVSERERLVGEARDGDATAAVLLLVLGEVPRAEAAVRGHA